MCTLRGLCEEDNRARDDRAPTLGSVLLRIEATGEIVVYPLLDRQYAPFCYTRLQALASAWAAAPEALAEVCELDPATVTGAASLLDNDRN